MMIEQSIRIRRSLAKARDEMRNPLSLALLKFLVYPDLKYYGLYYL